MRTLRNPILIAALTGTGGIAMAIEQPRYRVLEQDGDLEIREYEPYIVAETLVEDDFRDSGNEGFGRLFRYITGRNQSQASISMTAPVGQRAAGEEIAMTAPVSQRASAQGHWVSFMMPASFTLDTLPRPDDPRVRLREVPGQTVAAVRYSGFWSEARYQKEQDRLRAFMSERGLAATGEAQFARYDPPFMPPFMRRNEILVPIAGAAQREANAVTDQRRESGCQLPGSAALPRPRDLATCG